jgi:hypothetical protein
VWRPRLVLGSALLTLRAIVVAASVPLLVRFDLRHLQRWLEPQRSAARANRVTQLYAVEAVGRLVDRIVRIGKPVIQPGCLTRGITSYYLLRRAGLDAALCFGIRPMKRSSPTGHCWILLDGEPVFEDRDPRSTYTEIARLSSLGVTTANGVV